MTAILNAVVTLATRGEARASLHAYRELAADGLLFDEVLAGLGTAVAIEEYPDYFKGPCVLALQHDSDKRAIHALWGIPKNQSSPAVLITVYRPDPGSWTADLTRRRMK